MKGYFSAVRIAVTAFAIALIGVTSMPAIAGTKISEPSKAEALCRRVLGDKNAKSFVFKQIPAEGDCGDVFTLASSGKKIVIGGNSALSMATGLNYYLKYWCNVSLGFFRTPVAKLPSKMPAITQEVKINANCKDRFFLNYCTWGYTMPWWQWDQWEWLIDWMALNGINMPLTITGQESIWYKIWSELGLTDEQIRSYFTSPAHLPWHRMQNIDKWGGPLPKSWLAGQEELQRQIVARERELGMRTVLPAFAGHVPGQLKELYPNSKIDSLGLWGGFSNNEVCSFLDPFDPLFKEIQCRYIKKQTEIFGTDHIYGVDLFNEVTPPSWECDYLARTGSKVYETLAAADPQATWLQMGWLFYYQRKHWTPERVKAYITSYPSDKSILLDYFCEHQQVWQIDDKFSGVPFIWCYLGNFGGNTFLIGNLPRVKERIDQTKKECNNMVGIGATLEALDFCNTFMYEFVLENAWNIPQTADVENYATLIADRHCGKRSIEARDAWKILLHSVYCKGRPNSGMATKITSRPTLSKNYRYGKTSILYDNNDLLSAIKLLLDVDSHADAYEFDLVNFTRQWLGNRFGEKLDEYAGAARKADLDGMDRISAEMKQMIADTDALLSLRDEFSLGKWIDDARNWGIDDAEKLYFEKNARNLITTWGRPDSGLNDYANRGLSGLTRSFYAVRWNMFFDAVRNAVADHKAYNDDDAKEFHKNVCKFEGQWWDECRDSFTVKDKGDVKAAVRKIILRYHQ